MGYVLRLRLASFFAGATVASLSGLYLLQQDHKVFHQSLSRQMKELSDSLEGRVSALEKLKENKVPQHAEVTTE
ncbi:hypothetical protein M9H77_26349 [Catharanthus roseus]|uniref:Uncharacterized protein n=1 Tax=Catharanthus roseus TaxID=4058 RepID=A0ACC0ADH0_CATRO|nr:hypothetical protein M9H77_26349 [Catharanthus roseus]